MLAAAVALCRVADGDPHVPAPPELDDAAAAALFALGIEPDEHIGALFAGPSDTIGRTGTVSQGSRTSVAGTLSVPTGSLLGLFHNHPGARASAFSKKELSSRDVSGESFSADDKKKARGLGVPSFIVTPTGKVLRFDPASNETTEVLTLYPWDEMRKRITVDLLGRSIDDPRGMLR